MIGKTMSLSLCPMDKKVRFGLAADAADDALSLDVATAFVLLVLLGLETWRV